MLPKEFFSRPLCHFFPLLLIKMLLWPCSEPESKELMWFKLNLKHKSGFISSACEPGREAALGQGQNSK